MGVLRPDWVGCPPEAAAALVRLGPTARPAVPALARALKAPWQSVRFSASRALAKIGGAEVHAVLPALAAALDDEDRWVRIHAAQAVAAAGGDVGEVIPKIVDLLWDVAPGFQAAEVARALGRIGPAAADAVPALLACREMAETDDRDRFDAAIDRIMPRTPGATAEAAIAATASGGPAERCRAVYELGWLIGGVAPSADAPIIAALTAAVGDPDSRVRRMAAAVLGRLGTGAASARPDLARAARDPDPMVRRLAAWALKRTAPAQGRSVLPSR